MEHISKLTLTHLRSLAFKSLLIAVGCMAFISCKSESVDASSPVVQMVYTSDLHYGISRAFRGQTAVDASLVNQEMVKQINSLPTVAFPADGGVNAGKVIGAVDYMIVTGDITNRQQAPSPSATTTWAQFNTDYLNGITLKNKKNVQPDFLLTCGNHEVSNAIGYYKTMTPAIDNAGMVNIYNYMIKPATPKTASTYSYATDKPNYSKDIAGVHMMFVTMWPDSANRVWMEKDLATIPVTTPVVIFTHDQPDCESKHFTNPNGTHTINSTDKFENLLEERFKDGATTVTLSVLEQRGLVTFLKSHANVKAYFHGNDNKNEFYAYKGPDSNISLNVFRVDSPMKGSVTGLDAADGKGDETKLSFQVIAIDPNTKTLTVRECLWNTAGAASKVSWGTNSTISLK